LKKWRIKKVKEWKQIIKNTDNLNNFSCKLVGTNSEPLMTALTHRHVSHGLTYGHLYFTFCDFYARMQLLHALAHLSHRNSVCPSVCLSHGWISQKRCKLRSLNLHRRLPGRL